MGDTTGDDPRADEDARTIYCANLSDKITEEILYELFLQVNFPILIIISEEIS